MDFKVSIIISIIVMLLLVVSSQAHSLEGAEELAEKNVVKKAIFAKCARGEKRVHGKCRKLHRVW